MHAVRAHAVRNTHFLIEQGADIHLTDFDRRTALSWAIVTGRRVFPEMEIIDLLRDPEVSLDMLIQMYDAPILQHALITPGADIEDGIKRAHILSTIKDGLTEVVKYLLRHGRDPNGTDSSGNSYLIVASYGGDPELVQALINAGGLRQRKGRIRLHAAQGRRRSRSVRHCRRSSRGGSHRVVALEMAAVRCTTGYLCVHHYCAVTVSLHAYKRMHGIVQQYQYGVFIGCPLKDGPAVLDILFT